MRLSILSSPPLQQLSNASPSHGALSIVINAGEGPAVIPMGDGSSVDSREQSNVANQASNQPPEPPCCFGDSFFSKLFQREALLLVLHLCNTFITDVISDKTDDGKNNKLGDVLGLSTAYLFLTSLPMLYAYYNRNRLCAGVGSQLDKCMELGHRLSRPIQRSLQSLACLPCLAVSSVGLLTWSLRFLLFVPAMSVGSTALAKLTYTEPVNKNDVLAFSLVSLSTQTVGMLLYGFFCKTPDARGQAAI